MKKCISISTKNKLYLIDTADIMYCKCNNSSTTLFFENSQPVVISKGMSHVEKLLDGGSFIRPHQSYLVNRNYIVLVEKTHEYHLVLSNQVKIPVSTRRRKKIMEIIKTGVSRGEAKI